MDGGSSKGQKTPQVVQVSEMAFFVGQNQIQFPLIAGLPAFGQKNPGTEDAVYGGTGDLAGGIEAALDVNRVRQLPLCGMIQDGQG